MSNCTIEYIICQGRYLNFLGNLLGQGTSFYNHQKKPSFGFLTGSSNFHLHLASIIQINTVRTCRLAEIFVVFLAALIFFRHFLDFLGNLPPKIGWCDDLRTTAPLQNLAHQSFPSFSIEIQLNLVAP